MGKLCPVVSATNLLLPKSKTAGIAQKCIIVERAR
jgi:hypothetical protein